MDKISNKIDVLSLPVVPNVCQQVLREVEKREKWSMAHVIMNPWPRRSCTLTKKTR